MFNKIMPEIRQTQIYLLFISDFCITSVYQTKIYL